ncbi:hypothetical protein MNB_SV-9-599 [hydrothermal vent metagenome]|uniref:Uncharacterized protein n=1 Tax=hydrothermal vent metagenome TaxID=652676 RepID=A0A1W1BVF5_9ZZZZ
MKVKTISKLIASVLFTLSLSQAGTLVELHGTKGDAGTQLTDMVRKLDTIGYSTVGKNEHIETHYYKKYKEKNLDLLNFYTLVDKKSIRELLLANPDFGAYAPFNLLGFKKLPNAKGGDTTWYGHLDSDTMLDIIGEKDSNINKKFKVMVDKVDDLIQKEMKPTESKILSYDAKLPAQPLLKMVKKFNGVDDIEEFVEDFIVSHDTLFGKHNFIIAGFIDFKFEYDDMELDFEKYDAYWVSSLCHFQFSNSVFNHNEPQAAVFAPCSVYFYIPKGKNELHVGYATVENWIATTGIKDKAQLEYMQRIADDVVETFKELGFTVEDGTGGESAKAVATTRDLSTEISELKAMIKTMAKDIDELKKKEEIDSNSPSAKASTPVVVAPKVEVKKIEKPKNMVILPKKDFKSAKIVISDKVPDTISAYFLANPQTIEVLTYNLKINGFEVIATNKILKDKTVISITNEELKNTNSFLSVIHILVNGKDELRVQNPSYFGASYLQDKFKYGQFKQTKLALQKALGDMYISRDINKFSKLKDYHFMFGMPSFDDLITLKSEVKLKDKTKFAYTLSLPNGSTLIGHKMSLSNNEFLNIVNAENNAQILPYQSIVKDGKAVMLDPKYYLPLSLPLLTMTDFMKIRTIPDDIEAELKKDFK